jgi:hypothetical protein
MLLSALFPNLETGDQSNKIASEAETLATQVMQQTIQTGIRKCCQFMENSDYTQPWQAHRTGRTIRNCLRRSINHLG